jgi:ABC-type amino acid transport substrate-binding protein
MMSFARAKPFAAIVRRALVLMLVLWMPATPAHAQAPDTKTPAKIVVGTMRVPPFVVRSDDGQWSGLSVELWKQIAAELKTPYEFRSYDYDLDGLLDAVEQNKIDAAIAAIPITLEGEARFDFTHPYSRPASASRCATSRRAACSAPSRAPSVPRLSYLSARCSACRWQSAP